MTGRLRHEGMRWLFLAAGILLGFIFDQTAAAQSRAEFRRPLVIPFPSDAPYSPQMATLGKMLFFDPRLSGAQNINCASCHNPSFGWEVPVAGAIGAQNTALARQAPTILNAAFLPHFFWDGRAVSLEDQAAGPIQADVEMNADFDVIVPRLEKIQQYREWFGRLFPGEGVTAANILTAIGTFERTVVSGWAPFDRWVEGDEAAMSSAQIRGFGLFVGKAACVDCHEGWNFTDNAFHDIGLPGEDEGRWAIDDSSLKNLHAFKTPGLRNLTYRAPFMHDGSIEDLEAVILHYESGGIQRASLSDKMRPISLSDQERADLLAFLQALTAEKSDVSLPNLPN